MWPNQLLLSKYRMTFFALVLLGLLNLVPYYKGYKGTVKMNAENYNDLAVSADSDYVNNFLLGESKSASKHVLSMNSAFSAANSEVSLKTTAVTYPTKEVLNTEAKRLKTTQLRKPVFFKDFNQYHVGLVKSVKGFNFGLMKSGTSSLWRNLKMIPELEKVVSHYRCKGTREYERLPLSVTSIPGCSKHTCGQFLNVAVSLNRRPLDFNKDEVLTQTDCKGGDILEDTLTQLYPQVEYIDHLVSNYTPNEIVFVMTTRSTAAWVESIMNWFDASLRFMGYFSKQNIDGHFFDFDYSIPLTYKGINHKRPNNATVRKILAEIKTWHENRVRRKTGETGHKLIEFDISSNDTLGMQKNYSLLIERLTGQKYKNITLTWANKNTRVRTNDVK